MNGDPFGPVARAFDESAGTLRRAIESSRNAWNDEARRTYDARHGNEVESETAAARRGIEKARQSLRQAMAAL
ncbi:hypothetical protein [Actinoplanes sp. NPDC051411]|uniref:hypothetical protein n=1 Tax=Actinoplanes sp. NPDC051411 TaxID=3155522 RepID=UPI0034408791